MTNEVAEDLRRKQGQLEDMIKTKKQIFWVFVSTFGLVKNEHSLDVISQELILEDLF